MPFNTFPDLAANLPSVLQIPNGGSLFVYRVLKQAIAMIENGEFPDTPDDDYFVIKGNLEILLSKVGPQPLP